MILQCCLAVIHLPLQYCLKFSHKKSKQIQLPFKVIDLLLMFFAFKKKKEEEMQRALNDHSGCGHNCHVLRLC